MKIIEEIHHGDTHIVRTGEIPDDYESFVAFLQLSAYATEVVRPDNRYVRKAYDDLMAGRPSGFGWAAYGIAP